MIRYFVLGLMVKAPKVGSFSIIILQTLGSVGRLVGGCNDLGLDILVQTRKQTPYQTVLTTREEVAGAHQIWDASVPSLACLFANIEITENLLVGCIHIRVRLLQPIELLRRRNILFIWALTEW